MTNDPLYLRLLETSWRRKLTPAESAELAAWLKTHPEAQADWELEAGLNDLMERLPEAEVPSNFTARVLAEAQRPSRDEQKPDGIGAFWARRFSWLPRIAMASLVLGSGILAYHQYQQGRTIHEQQAMRAAAEIAMPSPEILTNLAAIRLMSVASATPSADTQLLSLLQ